MLFVLFYCLLQFVNGFHDVGLTIITPGAPTRVPLDFMINFTTTDPVPAAESITIRLPQFTRNFNYSVSNDIGRNLYFGQIRFSPSSMFTASWSEYFSNLTQTPIGLLHIIPKKHVILEPGIRISARVYAVNGIGAYCGFPNSDEIVTVLRPYASVLETFAISTNVSNNMFAANGSYNFEYFDGAGNGCSLFGNCNGHGVCDYCSETCECEEGYGSSSDIALLGQRVDDACSSRVCPVGKAIADIPTAATQAHATLRECSNVGLCNRATGLCQCFPPYNGSACERLACPNDCSGHGSCVSMREMSRVLGQQSPSYAFEYGTADASTTTAWDHDVMHGCLCDSSWLVGYEKAQVQLAEHFGPDCSLKHCPSGNDPFTAADEENCHLVSQPGAPGGHLGRVGNRCHVDCANRGICDYNTGRCNCFPGSWGDNCALIANSGTMQSQY